MAEQRFGNLTDIYESIVDWPKRLAREGPWYRRLFDEIGATSVVDVACGTGQHAAMFHRWGLRVEGADVSPEMIERARTSFGEPPGLRWTVRGFDQPVREEGSFDVAICVGNSLALAADVSAARQAVRRMLEAIRVAGVAVVHVLNVWRLPDGPCVWQKHVRADLPTGQVLIAKGIHRSGDRAYVDWLVTPLDAPAEAASESIPLLGIEAEQLVQLAREAGATSVELCGGYQSQTYCRAESTDLIMVARK
jgi:SAM-dependent methyltransferase